MRTWVVSFDVCRGKGVEGSIGGLGSLGSSPALSYCTAARSRSKTCTPSLRRLPCLPRLPTAHVASSAPHPAGGAKSEDGIDERQCDPIVMPTSELDAVTPSRSVACLGVCPTGPRTRKPELLDEMRGGNWAMEERDGVLAEKHGSAWQPEKSCLAVPLVPTYRGCLDRIRQHHHPPLVTV